MCKYEEIDGSKKLSKILRHRADIPHDEFGWFRIEDIEHYSSMEYSDILNIVYNNRRFALSEDGKSVRAYHGHSIQIKYEVVVEPPYCLYHGTSVESWGEIQASGAISPMKRIMVHLTESVSYVYNLVSRRCKSRNNYVILQIDASKMFANGYMFYKSGDGVYLTESVPLQYITILDKYDD